MQNPRRNNRNSSSTSAKFMKFVDTPMSNKRVTDVPGIGKVLGGKMERKGVGQASELYGTFLTMKKDQQRFESYLQTNYGANRKQAGEATKAICEWNHSFAE